MLWIHMFSYFYFNTPIKGILSFWILSMFKLHVNDVYLKYRLWFPVDVQIYLLLFLRANKSFLFYIMSAWPFNILLLWKNNFGIEIESIRSFSSTLRYNTQNLYLEFLTIIVI